MIQITLNNVTYSVTESYNGADRTLINLLKDKIVSYLLDDKEFYDTIINCRKDYYLHKVCKAHVR